MDFSNLQFTYHFKRNYLSRVGTLPERRHVIRTLRNSLKIQNGEWVIKDGERINTLSIYVNFSEGVAIQIDNTKKYPVAVSLRSKKQIIKKHTKNYTAMTRHELRRKDGQF